jgi:NAD(P)-dependent dehydrogenase (short-subunit alcohol dehydrogenase family)
VAENLFDLTGKVALVTGANSGLGFGYANGLARAGADVIIWGRREGRNLEAAERLRAHGGRIASRVVDVTQEDQVEDGMRAAVADFGQVDCVVANAGTATVALIDEMSSKTYHDLLNVNLHGVFNTVRAAAKHMKSRALAGRPGGSIILCGSLTIFAGVPGLAHYAAAKGGLNSLSKAVAVEMGAYEVRVNVIAPGLIVTEIVDVDPEMSKASLAMTAARSPIKAPGKPADLEGIVVYLASDLSRYHSGDTITLDGGMMAQMF